MLRQLDQCGKIGRRLREAIAYPQGALQVPGSCRVDFEGAQSGFGRLLMPGGKGFQCLSEVAPRKSTPWVQFDGLAISAFRLSRTLKAFQLDAKIVPRGRIPRIELDGAPIGLLRLPVPF
jgi:hypothetical protein